MAVTEVTTVKRYIGLSTDTKPTAPPIGSTYYTLNTGEMFIFDGSNWVDDISMIYAISQGMNP